SYHLAVTHDDHLQGVTLVTRGMDLFAATHVHRLLQALLGFSTPEYHHHAIVAGADGVRLAKRANAPTLRSVREAGKSAAEVISSFPALRAGEGVSGAAPSPGRDNPGPPAR